MKRLVGITAKTRKYVYKVSQLPTLTPFYLAITGAITGIVKQ